MATYFPERYTNLNPTPAVVGGVEAGTTFSTQSMAQVFDMLLYPYVAPTFGSFYLEGLNITNVEVGYTIEVDPSFTWTITHPENVQANSIRIVFITDTDTETLVSGLDADITSYQTTHDAITENDATKDTFRIYAIDTKGIEFHRDFAVTWSWMRYYGSDPNGALNVDDIQGLEESELASTGAGKYTFAPEVGSYKYIVTPYPLYNFIDQASGFSVRMTTVQAVSVPSIFGPSIFYRVYRTYYVINSLVDITIIAS